MTGFAPLLALSVAITNNSRAGTMSLLSRAPSKRLTLIEQLQGSGILANILNMVDDETLFAALRCRVFDNYISDHVVERVLQRLFGAAWKRYYEAYRVHFLSMRNLHPEHEQALPHQKCLNPNSSVWGMGYQLDVAPDSTIDWCVVRVALETIESIRMNCKCYDRSFVPSPLKDYCVDGVWFAENGRLLWIQSCSWAERHTETFWKSDCLNLTGTYLDYRSSTDSKLGDNTPLRLDGQTVWRDGWLPRTVKYIWGSYQDSARTPDFIHELWDLAATPEPKCLWSSFPASQGLRVPESYALPVRQRSDSYSFTGHLLPSMRPFRTLIPTAWFRDDGPSTKGFTSPKFRDHHVSLYSMTVMWLSICSNVNGSRSRGTASSFILAHQRMTNTWEQCLGTTTGLIWTSILGNCIVLLFGALRFQNPSFCGPMVSLTCVRIATGLLMAAG